MLFKFPRMKMDKFRLTLNSVLPTAQKKTFSFK